MRVAILQMLCLEKIFEEIKDNEKTSNFILDGKELVRDHKIESFQNKYLFLFVNGEFG